jgi:hypothetical protein
MTPDGMGRPCFKNFVVLILLFTSIAIIKIFLSAASPSFYFTRLFASTIRIAFMLALLLLSTMIQSPMRSTSTKKAFISLPHIFALNLTNTDVFTFVAALPDVFFILSIMIIPELYLIF